MSVLIMAMFNKLGCISGKTNPETGYAFDKQGKEIEGIVVKYCDGAREVRFETGDDKRKARRRELYRNKREEDSDTFEANKSYRREKYKNKGEIQ